MSVILDSEVVAWVEAQAMACLHSGGEVGSVDVGNDDVAKALSDLSSLQLEVTFWTEASFRSFFKSSPAVSHLDASFGWIVDHWVRVVRVHT